MLTSEENLRLHLETAAHQMHIEGRKKAKRAMKAAREVSVQQYRLVVQYSTVVQYMCTLVHWYRFIELDVTVNTGTGRVQLITVH